ncbi:hypothetical protein BZA05DRAFT_182233 [Tricharina praecox]|uniref:uncharacterized protein n=1 Tax=Tricharina praecox TaxID=43433 RepID=UPI00221FF51F|nr:uncharacterized protein BZA05DRAFT_182233 [Tricharina praecox]KAI5843603.1 hypothetical protein BZA05DRAFT_182233 [Tricharina praecox]
MKRYVRGILDAAQTALDARLSKEAEAEPTETAEKTTGKEQKKAGMEQEKARRQREKTGKEQEKAKKKLKKKAEKEQRRTRNKQKKDAAARKTFPTGGQSTAINSSWILSRKLAEIDGIYSPLWRIVPADYRCYFWKEELIRRLSCTSSHTQDPTVLLQLQEKLRTPKFESLRRPLQEFLLSSQCIVACKRAVAFDVLSDFLKRMRSSELLSIEDRWYTYWGREIQHSNQPYFAMSYEIVTCVRNVRKNTTARDFPGPFSESLHKLLSRLEHIQDISNEPGELVHSASVLSVYEELVILLLFLSRPEEFVLPKSWTVLHSSLPLLAKIPRFMSERETFWYQSLLTRVIALLCRLICRVETEAPTLSADGLAHRAVLIIIIAIINLGDLKPLPIGYRRMWDATQKVFDLGSLRPHASFFQNSPPGQLLQVLSDEFAASTGYAGKDHLQVVVTDGSTCSMPLPAVYLGLSKPLAKRPEPNRRESHASILVRERMKAAYTHVVNYNWRMQSCEELG